MKWKNAIFGCVMIVLSVFVLIYQRGFPGFAVRGRPLPGPGFFPVVLSIVLIIIGGYEIGLDIKAWMKRRKLTETPPAEESTITPRGILNLIVVLGGILLFVPLIELVGFRIGTFVFAMAIMKVLGVKLWKSAVFSGILTVVIVLIFGNLFRVPFPEGTILPF